MPFVYFAHAWTQPRLLKSDEMFQQKRMIKELSNLFLKDIANVKFQANRSSGASLGLVQGRKFGTRLGYLVQILIRASTYYRMFARLHLWLMDG